MVQPEEAELLIRQRSAFGVVTEQMAAEAQHSQGRLQADAP